MLPADFPSLLQTLMRLRDAAPDCPLYLVGGSIRDLLLNRPVKDLDLATSGPVEELGREIARHLGGSFFYLRRGEETARIVIPSRRKKADQPDRFVGQIDLVSMRGETIEEDLQKRDFTVNAMAFDLSRNPLPDRMDAFQESLIDPLGGWDDLKADIVRRCSSQSLPDDPLRTLRAVRLQSAFGWRIEEETRSQIREVGERLSQISSERIRDELFQMLQLDPVPRTLDALSQLDDLSLLEAALRGPADRNGFDCLSELDVMLHSEGIRPLQPTLDSYLQGEITPGRTRLGLIRLAFIISLHEEGEKPEAGLVSRLALSAAESRYVYRGKEGAEQMAHALPEEADVIGWLRVFQGYGDAVPAVLLLALTWTEDERKRPILQARLEDALLRPERFNPPLLLDGRDLMKAFQTQGGSWVAEFLDVLREAQVRGDATSEEQAWQVIRRAAVEKGLPG